MGSEAIVLIVDDDKSVRNALARLVRSVGLEAETFSAAQEFFDSPLPDRPACVVLDVRLPGRSGLQVQEEMRLEGVEIPIVFISGHGDIPMSVRAMKAGAVDFLEKPFSQEELLGAIQKAVELDRDNRSERAEQKTIEQRLSRLTPREREVMEWVITGRLNKQIAYKLGTSEKTIKVHRGRVMEKMEAESLPDLVRMAQKVGIEGPEGI